MTGTLSFSIVTPSFNQAEFLNETLASVLSQEGDFLIDYLVMDGGSSDESLDIIKNYAEKLHRNEWPIRCRGIQFRWVSEKDHGQTDALIKGFNMASGEIFAWLNSDDVYLPGAIQTAAALFCEYPETSFLYGDAHYCDSTGAVTSRYPTEGFDLERLAYCNFFCQPSTFFRREAFEAVGGLNKNLNFTMDYDLFIRLSKSYKCYHLPVFFSKYRLHEASKTMCSFDLYKYHQEILSLTLKYFDWAPLNQVYGLCHSLCLSKLPDLLKKYRLFVVFPASFCAIFRSLQLNKGLRRNDLKLLHLNNVKKIFKSREEILRG